MDFNDIRAYPESLFFTYWQKVVSDPHFQAIVEKLGNGKHLIKGKVFNLNNLEQFRSIMFHLMDRVVKKTTKGVTYSGIEELQKKNKNGSIFISNHRSTSLDPLFFNHMLQIHTGDMAFNAAGDNLLNTSWLGHLIRLNKGFVVKRTIQDPMEKLREAQKLSLYIRSLVEKGKNVWIAQRNGRAKDGNDLTDSAVLSMLKLSHREKSWEEMCQQVPIIPISMSYEEIPLDTLMVKDRLGLLDKSDQDRDKKQIFSELGGQKRRVHIHISPRIIHKKKSELVKSLDSNIIRGTKIWESNRYAALRLRSIGKIKEKPLKWFKEKLNSQEAVIQEALLELYAAPTYNQHKLLNNI